MVKREEIGRNGEKEEDVGNTRKKIMGVKQETLNELRILQHPLQQPSQHPLQQHRLVPLLRNNALPSCHGEDGGIHEAGNV